MSEYYLDYMSDQEASRAPVQSLQAACSSKRRFAGALPAGAASRSGLRPAGVITILIGDISHGRGCWSLDAAALCRLMYDGDYSCVGMRLQLPAGGYNQSIAVIFHRGDAALSSKPAPALGRKGGGG